MVEYQKNIYGVDICDQHRTVDVELTNTAHFPKCYEQDFLGISDFSLLQEFPACNMLVDLFRYRGRCGALRNNKMVKY